MLNTNHRRDIDLAEVNYVIKWYDSIANSYDELYANDQLLKYEALSKYLSRDVGNLLDVGCGTGLFLRYLLVNGYRVNYYVCLDVSTEIIKNALSRSRYLNSLADFIIADLTYPPIREGGLFTYITLITVLRGSYNITGIISKYLRLLKQNGLILYTVLSKDLSNEAIRYEVIYVKPYASYPELHGSL